MTRFLLSASVSLASNSSDRTAFRSPLACASADFLASSLMRFVKSATFWRVYFLASLFSKSFIAGSCCRFSGVSAPATIFLGPFSSVSPPTNGSPVLLPLPRPTSETVAVFAVTAAAGTEAKVNPPVASRIPAAWSASTCPFTVAGFAPSARIAWATSPSLRLAALAYWMRARRSVTIETSCGFGEPCFSVRCCSVLA